MRDLNPLLGSLSDVDDIAYVLGPDRCILQTNQGWTRFALANRGATVLQRWGHGEKIDDALPEPLRAFYVDSFARVLASGERWEHDYECSSDEQYRQFRMVVYPIEGRLLVVVNALRVEQPHAREAFAPGDGEYAVHGIITMCSHCRRVRNPAEHQRWDWVPAYVRAPPPNLSHGLCEPCYAFYWGDLMDEDDAPR